MEKYAMLLTSNGSESVAEDLLKEVLAFYQSHDMHKEGAIAMEHLANACKAEKNLTCASEYAREALQVYEALGEMQGKARVYAVMAQISLLKNEFEDAIQFANLAVNTSGENAPEEQLWTMLGVEALASLSLGETGTALAALEDFESPGAKNGPFWLASIKGKMALENGNLNAAKSAFAALDTLQNPMLFDPDYQDSKIQKEIYTRLAIFAPNNSDGKVVETTSHSIPIFMYILLGILLLGCIILLVLWQKGATSWKAEKQKLEAGYQKRGEAIKELKKRGVKAAETAVQQQKDLLAAQESLANAQQNSQKALFDNYLSGLLASQELLAGTFEVLDGQSDKSFAKWVSDARKAHDMAPIWEEFDRQFDQQFPAFRDKIKRNHDNLTDNDIRISMLLRIGLPSKGMAALLQITPHAVDVARYRLRKKMELEKGANLQKYIDDL